MDARRLYSLFLLSIFWLASCALAGCLVQAEFGYPFRRTVHLDASRIAPLAGHAYVAPIPHWYLPLGGQATSSRLIEGTHTSTLYSQNVTSVGRLGLGIFSFTEGVGLIFSATDNSDPRSNDRRYAIDLPLRISRIARFVCVLIWVAVLILQFSHLPFSAGTAPGWIRKTGKALSVAVISVGRYPLLLLALPSVYLLLLLPPLWKDVDAVAQLILPAGASNILHFPPVYCFLGRIPFLMASSFPTVGSGGSIDSLFAQQHPTLAGLYLLVFFQHLLLVTSLAYVVLALSENLFLRGVFALILAASSAFYLYAHSCGSEGLSGATIFAMFASGISIIRNRGFVHWALYGGALFLAIGCRHINVLFILWLPFTLIALMLAQRLGWCDAPRSGNRFKSAALALLVGLLAYAANFSIARVMIAAVHDDYRSTLGRTLSDRIDSFLDRLHEPDRVRLAKDVAATTSDPMIKAAIMSQATTGSFYHGTDQNIAQELIRSGVRQEKIGPESDQVILQATLRYLQTLHPVLLSVILHDFVAGFTNASNQRIAYGVFDANKSAAVDRAARPDAWKSIAQWPAMDLPYATYLVDYARVDPYINLEGSVRLGFLVVLTIGLSLFACVRRRRLTENVTVALCVLGFGAFVYGVNTVCVYYMARYTLPLFAAIVVALLVAIAAQDSTL
jgi:hypothetical protein